MIRNATISDAEPIAKMLWATWQQLKIQQIPTASHNYRSSQILIQEIHRDLNRWLVCESSNPQQQGFFSLNRLGGNKTFKRWGFPESAVRIEHFGCLQKAEIILHQLSLLVSQLHQQSILLCVATPLRDAYWAALKAEFKLLGESHSIIGTAAWLYYDCDGRFKEIQEKLTRAKIVTV
jgi:hypothetical protein